MPVLYFFTKKARGQGRWNVIAASLAYPSRDVRSLPSCSSAPIEFALVSRPLSEGVHAPRENLIAGYILTFFAFANLLP
jgi:hypothetical protein